MSRRSLAASLLALFLVSLATGQPGDPPLVAGEIIVKVSERARISPQIALLMTAHEPAAAADVSAYVETLSDEAGLPFAFDRVTSGRELVLVIRRDAVLHAMAERIREHDAVKGVDIAMDDAGSPFYRQDRLIVDFDRCSDAYRKLANLPSDDAATPPEVKALASSLVGDDRYHIQGTALPGARLAIGVDFRQLTLQLARQLNERADVDYAQPNYGMRISDGGASARNAD